MPKKRNIPPPFKIPTKKIYKSCLSKDAQLEALYHNFEQVTDVRKAPQIPTADVLMSGFALIDLKDSSLLAFDNRRQTDAANLEKVYGIGQVACDTQIRAVADPIDPDQLRANFKALINLLQRGNALQQLTYYEGYYLLAMDGSGSYNSNKITSDACQTKKHRNGTQTYYQQVLAASLVHPDFQVVIPLAPEMIIPQDGSAKNDCERNATKRFLPKFREDFPRLPVIIIEDGISSNAPHIEDLTAHGARYILGAKPGDHALLFHNFREAVEQGTATTFSSIDPKDSNLVHTFSFINNVSLNQSNLGLKVNFMEHMERNLKTGKVQKFSWVTDFTITKDNAYILMRGGRCRWKIENETFNTLKNQGYHFGHNFGLGKKNLSAVFVMLMMLAFLVEQIQELCSPMYKAALEKAGSRKELWYKQRSLFLCYKLDSMAMIYLAIINGFRPAELEIIYDE
jgi:hypothetical protein